MRAKWEKAAALVLAALVVGVSGMLLFAYYPAASLDERLARAGLTEKDFDDATPAWILIKKKDKRLVLMHGDKAIKTYRISTGPGIPEGSGPPDLDGRLVRALVSLRYYPGDKKFRGDLRTPEGEYELVYDFRESRANYLFSLISYPDDQDRAESSDPGGSVGIHGLRPGANRYGRLHTLVRHTRGCIALNNHEIDELARVVGAGTRVVIEP